MIRPGRVDRKQLIGRCSSSQLEAMFSRFYPENSHQDAREFAERVIRQVGIAGVEDKESNRHGGGERGVADGSTITPSLAGETVHRGGISAAAVQGFFMRRKDDGARALQECHRILDDE